MAMFNDTVSHKKKFLASLIKAPFDQLAIACGPVWANPDELTRTLQQDLRKLPHCQLLYAIDISGKQVSANISRPQIDNTWRGQDLSARPYLRGNLPFRGMTLSAAYLSQRSLQPCITAVQAVHYQDTLLGFIAADFHIKDLPEMSAPALRRLLRQPAAGQLGKTARIISAADDHIDYLNYLLITLMQEHGIVQFQLHYNSARCALWATDTPLHYELYSIEDLMKPDIFTRYAKQPYCKEASLDPDKIPFILAQLKTLREANSSNYLRSASLNLINGMVSLSFASDGTEYLQATDFLNQELNQWLEQPTPPVADATATQN